MKKTYKKYLKWSWEKKLGFFIVVFLVGVAIQTILDYLVWWWMK